MARENLGFTYSDLLECLAVLRRGAYGRQLAELVALLGSLVMDRDLKQMLRYFVRKGTIKQELRKGGTRYVLSGALPGDSIVQLKMAKSREKWNGKWTVFTYDMPERNRNLRRRLARLLRRMGFEMLSASSWVSPYDWRDELDRTLSAWQCKGTFSYIRSAEVQPLCANSRGYPANRWDVRDVGIRYERVARRCDSAPAGGGLQERQVRARLMLASSKEIASIEETDPMLPAALLPDKWGRDRALQSLNDLRRAVYIDSKGTA